MNIIANAAMLRFHKLISKWTIPYTFTPETPKILHGWIWKQVIMLKPKVAQTNFLIIHTTSFPFFQIKESGQVRHTQPTKEGHKTMRSNTENPLPLSTFGASSIRIVWPHPRFVRPQTSMESIEIISINDLWSKDEIHPAFYQVSHFNALPYVFMRVSKRWRFKSPFKLFYLWQ